MADTKISALTAATVALAQELAVNDAGTSKKLTVQKVLDAIDLLGAAAALADADEMPVIQSAAAKGAPLSALVTYLQSKGMARVKSLAADHAISSTTGTEVTGLGPMTLEAGTYIYRFELLVRSATTTVGIGLGVNFTGTAAVRSIHARYPSTGTAAISGVMTNVGAAAGQIEEHNVQTAFSTTAPNIINTAGFQAINTNVPVTIDGILVVTASGDLELWHSSETATSTSVMAGSSLAVTRTA